MVEACLFERSADRRGSRSKVLAVPQTWSARSVQGARREICDDREMLFNVFRGGAPPSSIASTVLSILHRCIRGEESSQIILEVIGLPMLSVGGKDCVVSRMAGKHPILAKFLERIYLVKKRPKKHEDELCVW